jgi:hypothetical protein
MDGTMASARRETEPDAESASLEASIRAELEAEHLERLEEFARTRERARARGRERAAQRDEVESAELRRRLREEFYREKGYVRYTDSRGREKWIPAEESEWRSRVRQRNNRHGGNALTQFVGRHRQAAVWLLVVLGAVGVGLYLVR